MRIAHLIFRSRNTRRGSLLIMILWVLAILSIFSLVINQSARLELKKLEHLENRIRLRLAADAGIRKAAYVLDHKPKRALMSDALKEEWSMNEEAFRDVPVGDAVFSITNKRRNVRPAVAQTELKTFYGLVDEERKINLNFTRSPETLLRLFQAIGLDHDNAYALSVSILDWLDVDDNPYERGAESHYYLGLDPPYRPKNAELGSLEEMLLIKGISRRIYEGVLPFITLDSNGKININTAGREVLAALGVTESLIRKILAYRAGTDGIEGTSDDNVFKDLSSIVENINGWYPLADSERTSLQSFVGSGTLSTYSENFKAETIVHLTGSRGLTLHLSCVLQRYGAIKRWQEYFSVA